MYSAVIKLTRSVPSNPGLQRTRRLVATLSGVPSAVTTRVCGPLVRSREGCTGLPAPCRINIAAQM